MGKELRSISKGETPVVSAETANDIASLKKDIEQLQVGQTSNANTNHALMGIIIGVLAIIALTLVLWLVDSFVTSQQTNLELIQALEKQDERTDAIEQMLNSAQN